MRVVYFHRDARGSISDGLHYIEVFYVPDEHIALFRSRQGAFVDEHRLYILNREDILTEARTISTEFKAPEVRDVKYSHVRHFDYDESKLRKAIEAAKVDFLTDVQKFLK